ncbi:MAG: PorT family protein [Flavobacteriales bacterium]|nr:PorT family protein [Flavobacteriales bacterium]
MPKSDAERRFKFGFTLAANSINFKEIKNPDVSEYPNVMSVQSKNYAGFLLGILSNMRINEWYDLRFMPAISFGERSLEYRIADSVSIKSYEKKVESTFLEFPVMIKYKSNRLNNMRMYVIGGIKYTIDLASQAKVDNDNFTIADKIIKIKQDDLSWEVGVGIDFYLQFFKLSIELKKSFGLRDILVQDNTVFSTPIESLRSQMTILSFHFSH